MTSLEVADLLGVRLETVYAYASRGLLHSERAPGRRGSTFDRAEVEALRGGARRPRLARVVARTRHRHRRHAGARGAAVPAGSRPHRACRA
nr:helix-turn-helix domain-containing protein [Angustibacter aerolatus]